MLPKCRTSSYTGTEYCNNNRKRLHRAAAQETNKVVGRSRNITAGQLFVLELMSALSADISSILLNKVVPDILMILFPVHLVSSVK